MNAALRFARDTLIAAVAIFILLYLMAWRSTESREQQAAARPDVTAEKLRAAREKFARQKASGQVQDDANRMMHPLAQVPVKDRP